MKKLFYLLPCALFTFSLHAQQTFSQLLKLNPKSNDYGRGVVETKDSGFAIAGLYYDSLDGESYAYLAKLSSKGQLLWGKEYKQSGIQTFENNSLIQTTDGGFAMVGSVTNFNALRFTEMCVIKTDKDGNIQWTKSIGGSQGNDWGRSIVETTDGGFAVAGYTNAFTSGNTLGDIYLAKLDKNGNFVFAKYYGGNGVDGDGSVVQASDGGYIISGSTTSFGNDFECLIIKTDANGNKIWAKTIGGTGSDYAKRVIKTSDNNYVLAGYTSSYGAGSYDHYVVKISQTGSLVWAKAIGAAGNDYGYSLIQSDDGGFVTTGATFSFGTTNNIYVNKVDGNGNLLWARALNDTKIQATNDFSGEFSIARISSGGYAIVSAIISPNNSHPNAMLDICLLKTSRKGEICSGAITSGSIKSGGVIKDVTAQLFAVNAGDAVNLTLSTFNTGTSNKLCSGAPATDIAANNVEADNIAVNNVAAGVFISPNPVKGNVLNISLRNMQAATVQCTIINASGKTMLSQPLSTNITTQKTLNVSQLSAGMYFMQVTDGNKTYSTKFIKE